MARTPEKAYNYFVNIAERAIGIDAYNRYQQEIDTLYADRKDQSPYKARRTVGMVAGVIQFLVPGFSEGVADVTNRGARQGEIEENPIVTLGRSTLKGSFDYGSWHLIAALSDTPLEFFALKIVANAATPVVFDLASVAVNKIKRYKSSTVISA